MVDIDVYVHVSSYFKKELAWAVHVHKRLHVIGTIILFKKQ